MARPEWSSRITSGRPRRSTPCLLTPSAPAGPLADRRNAPNGAAIPVPSPIPKGTCGRLHTTPTGPWQRTGPSDLGRRVGPALLRGHNLLSGRAFHTCEALAADDRNGATDGLWRPRVG